MNTERFTRNLPYSILPYSCARRRIRLLLRHVEGDEAWPCEAIRMTTFVIDAPAAIDLATNGSPIPPEHSLAAPTLMRSQALALVYQSVHRGEIDERTGRKILDRTRGLRIRLLGDRSLQDRAWRIAVKLNWPDTYQAEYIALTQLQADALATADKKLAAAARAFVQTVSPAAILRSST